MHMHTQKKIYILSEVSALKHSAKLQEEVNKMKPQIEGTMMHPFHAFLTGIFYVK